MDPLQSLCHEPRERLSKVGGNIKNKQKPLQSVTNFLGLAALITNNKIKKINEINYEAKKNWARILSKN